MESICPNYEKCPIYNGILKDKLATGNAYKQIYCQKADKYKTCKRYLVKEATGSCPENMLPNDTQSVEELIQRYHLERRPN